MKLPVFLCQICCLVPAWALAQPPDLTTMVDPDLESLVGIYKGIHAAPEMSHHEEKTSALLVRQLRSLGFEVTERVGK